MGKKILIIDDDPDICMLLAMFLEKHGYNVTSAHSGVEALTKCRESDFDAVFCDYVLGDINGLDLLAELKRLDPWMVVLMMTGQSDIRKAVELIKAGAFDYFSKPLLPEEILKTLDRALTHVTVENDRSFASGYVLLSDGNVVISKSAASKALYHRVNIAASRNGNLLLCGESGSGKQVVAQTIHYYSNRKSGLFVSVNCGSIGKEMPQGMLSIDFKELFEQSFLAGTGPLQPLEGGSLFLCGINDLSLEAQSALLHVLQNNNIGAFPNDDQDGKNIRIIAAASSSLEDACNKGQFSAELFALLNEYSIAVPALRLRSEDILSFANYFLEKVNMESGKHVEGFDEEVLAIFHQYDWPGNLRELRNVIRRAALNPDRGRITADSMPSDLLHAVSSPGKRTYSSQVLPEVFRLKRMKAEAEYNTIVDVLKKVNHNKTKAAEILNVDRKTLYNKIKMYQAGAK